MASPVAPMLPLGNLVDSNQHRNEGQLTWGVRRWAHLGLWWPYGSEEMGASMFGVDEIAMKRQKGEVRIQ